MGVGILFKGIYLCLQLFDLFLSVVEIPVLRFTSFSYWLEVVSSVLVVFGCMFCVASAAFSTDDI